MDDYRENARSVNLGIGDLIIDSVVGSIGVLIELEDNHEVAGYYYKSTFWKVYWVSLNPHSAFAYNGALHIEEYGLKMSILIGIYDHYPSDCNKSEKI